MESDVQQFCLVLLHMQTRMSVGGSRATRRSLPSMASARPPRLRKAGMHSMEEGSAEEGR